MFVVDRVGDHDVADLGVQGRRLAKDVDARDPGAVLGNLPEDVVRGKAERVVDVDDARGRRAQFLLVDRTDAWVDRGWVQL
jgi:hypothetical protein